MELVRLEFGLNTLLLCSQQGGKEGMEFVNQSPQENEKE